MVPEARIEQSEAGLVAATEGWFVVNVGDAAWVSGGHFGDACVFVGDAPYHREGNQEDFLVVAGECLLLVEGEERRLKTWDFVHCPPGTEHIFVGTGDGPCVVFMAGARGGPTDDDLYVRSEPALRHGAGVEKDTTSSQVAYAPFQRWKPGPPESFDGFPWALP